MRHNHTVNGSLFRLRPVDDGDAAFIVSLRSERGEFFQKGASTVEEQLLWQREYYERPNDYYFIVERKDGGGPVGTVAAYDIDSKEREVLFGRWLIINSSSAATESVFLIYRFIFEELNMSAACALTVDGNEKVVSFHNSCGLKISGVERGKYHINGRDVDAVKQVITADMWKKDVSVRLESLMVKLSGRGRKR